jgi:hypothetical protein
MLALPIFTPVTCGCVAGVVAPCRMFTEAGEIVTLDVSLLERFTVTAAGAGTGSVMRYAADCPILRTVLDGRIMDPALCTVTLRVASAIFGTLLA